MTSRALIAAGLIWSAGTVAAQQAEEAEAVIDPIAQAIAEREAALGIGPASEPVAEVTDAGEADASEPVASDPVASETAHGSPVAEADAAEPLDPIAAAIAAQEAALGLTNAAAAEATAEAAPIDTLGAAAETLAETPAGDGVAGADAATVVEAEPEPVAEAEIETAPVEPVAEPLAEAEAVVPEVAVAPVVAVAAGEAETPEVAPAAVSPLERADLLVMPPDVEIQFITTGGMEMRADWTEAARSNFVAQLPASLEGKGYTLVGFDETSAEAEPVRQLLLLRELVALSSGLPMPHKTAHKGKNLGLTLGPDAALLAEAHGADKAIFLEHVSRIESSGVFIAQVAVGAATSLATGVTTVPASGAIRMTTVQAIDLTTGDVIDTEVWLGGEAREADGAGRLVERLLKRIDLEAE